MAHRFMVTNISQAGPGRVTVNFTEVSDTFDPAVGGPTNDGGFINSLSLNMPSTDGKTFFPGDIHTMTLTVETLAAGRKKSDLK